MKIECTVEELKELVKKENKHFTDEEKSEIFDYINKKLAERY